MAYIPGCSSDVFISYAHRDNLDGWVTRLKDKLTEKLMPFLAGRAEVWFDDRIRPGLYFKDEIQKKLKDTPIFVAVVSPSYLDSEFSIIDELEWFQNQGGSEVIQLLKVPLDKGQEVPLPTSEYELLHDPTDGHLLEGDALERVLDKVVAAITRRLREFWELRPKIYMAQIRNELWRPPWDELKGRLHIEGYALLPRGILPQRVPDGRIRESLDDASLSVHLASLADDPLAFRQLEIARQTGRPIITLPAPPTRDRLSAIAAEVQSRLVSDRPPTVYLIYDYYSDHSRIAALPELIRANTGYDVIEPAAGETYHKFRLQVSDGVLLFRGDAPDDWLKSQEQALLQADAFRSLRRTVEAKYFIRRSSADPAGVRVTQGARQEWIIERTGEPDAGDLQPFFDALRLRRHAAGGAA
jgi:hypothetical protein